jgi:CubicO group peptidase (beta-lactamase class C family)
VKVKTGRTLAGLYIFVLASLTPFIVVSAFSVKSPDPRWARVDKVFAEWDTVHSPGCALAVIKDGRIIYTCDYGMADLDHDVLIKPSTVFMLASISKQFTAACILLLQKEGKLSLEDDIRKYIPEMPVYEWPVRIRHLLHHTGGVRDYEFLQFFGGEISDQGHHRNDDLLELVARQKGLDFRPGEKFQYSNSGYLLLAVIVERITGKSLGQFAKERIFDPLGMKKTFIYEDNRAIIKDRAIGYSKKEDGGFKVDESLNESTGDGGVYTTLDDFFLWDQNFYKSKIGGPDFVRNMLLPGRLNDGRVAGLETNGIRIDYASGLILTKYRGLRTFGHDGFYVGFRACFRQFPDQKFSTFLMSNLGDINPGALSEKVADICLEDIFPEKAPEASKKEKAENKKEISFPLTTQKSAEYIGDYASEELRATYQLRNLKNGLFFVQKNAPDKNALKPSGRDAFVYSDLGLRFSRDSGGRVIGFTIQAGHLKGISFTKTAGTPPSRRP